jgi:ABC-type Zn2+ transport system substrate-binding protein/surface adhesin
MKIAKALFPQLLSILIAVCFCSDVNCVSNMGNALKKLFGGKVDPKNVHLQQSKSLPQLDRRKRAAPQELDDTDSESNAEDEETSDMDPKQSDREDEQDEEATDTEQSDKSDERLSSTSGFRYEVDRIRKALLHPENKEKRTAAIRAVRELIILMCDNFEDSTDTRRE